jgi:esterase/lipase superfamily enzyme
VILAAPDIDATIFKQRIAPSIVTKARRITLYASSKDLALFASRQFNSGDPRAGDAGDEIVVVSGIETIDASAGDSSLLGHCYYGNSVSVLRDIEHLLKDQPPEERPFLHPRAHQGMTYWIFNPAELASQTTSSSGLR